MVTRPERCSSSRLLRAEEVVPFVAHGAGGSAGRGDRGGLRRGGRQADPAAQTVTVERESPVAEGARVGDRGVQVVDLVFEGQHVVVALAAAGEVEGQRRIPGLGERRSDAREPARERRSLGKAVRHDDDRRVVDQREVAARTAVVDRREVAGPAAGRERCESHADMR